MRNALVVEDNRTVANLEAELLASVGVSSEIVDCGEAAIGKLLVTLYDFIVLNGHVAGQVTGLHVLKFLKNDRRPKPTILFVTGNATPELAEADCVVLKKPLDEKEFLQTVQNAMPAAR